EDEDDGERADSIQVGGNGRPQVDSIWQIARIKRTSKAVLRFDLRIKTDNKTGSSPEDSLVVQARTASGKLLKTLARFSHVHATKRPRIVRVDVSGFRGQSIRLQFTSRENSTRATRFSIRNARIEYPALVGALNPSPR